MLDQYGEEIFRNDIITYPVRKNSEMFMRTAIVREIYYTENHLNKTIPVIKAKAWINGNLKTVRLENNRNITIIPKYKIRNNKFYNIYIGIRLIESDD